MVQDNDVNSKDNFQRLCDAIVDTRNGLVVVVTGAGISHASGIATFRGTDPEAVWNRDVTELGTRRFFEQDPVASWQWYLKRFDTVLGKKPNPAHRALVQLEQWQLARGGDFLLVTQNIDTLHEDAGSRAMIKVHGTADRIRCSRQGCENGAPAGSILRRDVDMQRFLAAPSPQTLPKCPICGAVLRQHVLWFDELYDEHESYQWERVLQSARSMDLCLFVGTSFSVGVTELFVRTGVRAQRFAVDPGLRESAAPHVTIVRDVAENLLPALSKTLRINGD